MLCFPLGNDTDKHLRPLEFVEKSRSARLGIGRKKRIPIGRGQRRIKTRVGKSGNDKGGFNSADRCLNSNIRQM